MDSLDERMRQFTVVVKFAMETGQLRRGGVRRVGEPNLLKIASNDFQLTPNEYSCCYSRAQQLLKRFRNSLTSDDMINHREAA